MMEETLPQIPTDTGPLASTDSNSQEAHDVVDAGGWTGEFLVHGYAAGVDFLDEKIREERCQELHDYSCCTQADSK
jgi:hypothetical protein